MKTFALGFLLGTACIYLLHGMPPLAWGIVSLLLTMLCIALGIIFKKSLAFLFGGFAGFTLLIAHLVFFTPSLFPSQLEKKDIFITATISEIQKASPQSISFLVNTSNINQQPDHRRILLGWYTDMPDLKLGQIWNLHVRLKRIHGFANPAGMDFEKWAFSEGISASGYVVDDPQNHCIGVSQNFLTKLRAQLFQKITRLLPSDPISPALLALTLGMRQGLDTNTWMMLQNTGTSHLMAIAGLHLGMATIMIMLLANFFWKMIPIFHRYPRQQFSALWGLCGALFYSLLSGFSLPAERAFIMLSVILLALLAKRHLRLFTGFTWALLVILVWDPLAVLSISFWLSFGAVGSILYGMSFQTLTKSWQQHLYLQGVITLGILPLTLWFFQKISLVSPLANLIVVPWVGFIVIPLCLLGVVLLFLNLHFLAHSIFCLAHFNLAWIFRYLNFLANTSFSAINLSLSSAGDLFFLYLALACLLLPLRFPGKWLGLFFLIPVFFPRPLDLTSGEVKITVLDVGQGLSVFLQTRHHTVIYDTGPKFPNGLDAGEAVLAPMLWQNHLSKIDLLMVSHSDNDHSGGAGYVLDHFAVSQFLTSDPAFFKGRKVNVCEAGQSWNWDGVQFRVIYPLQNLVMKKNNDRSCVLKVTTGNHSILLPGDIEKPAEKILVADGGLASTILLAPHHGSKTSSTQAFIEAVYPEWVIFSTGYLNRFHFPNPLIAARYKTDGVHELNIADTGAVTIFLSPTKIQIQPFRQTYPRIWRLN